MTEQSKLWCVYKHTNKSNGKVYIGKTCKKPEYRWNEGKGYFYQKHFWYSISKYGWDGFTHEVIRGNLNAEEASDLEKQLIAYYDSMNPDKGYNQTAGGEGVLGWHHTNESRQKIIESNKKRHISEESKKKQSETHKRWIAETGIIPFKGQHHSEKTKQILSEKAKLREPHPVTEETKRKISIAHLGRKMGPLSEEHKRKLSEAHKGHPVSEETREKMSLRFSGEKNPMYGKTASTAKGVVQYTMDGKELARFSSAMDACKATGLSNVSIGECCKGKLYTVGGFVWGYEGDETTYRENIQKYNSSCGSYYRPVIQMSLDGETVSVYENASCKELSLFNRYQIIDACRKKRPYKKAYWCFEDDADILLDVIKNEQRNREKQYEGRHILQFTLDGDLMNVFNSVSEASEKTGCCNSSISACCRRTAKTCGSTFFFYEKDVTEAFLNEAIENNVRNSRWVAQYDKYGHFVKDYRSGHEAAKSTGVSESAIYQNCNMQTLETKGFFFLFVNEDLERNLAEKLRSVSKESLKRPSRRRSYENKKATTNILADRFPEIAAQWHPTKNGDLKPDQITSGSGKVVWWIDEFGHEWPSTVGNRTSQSLGCPYCGNQKLLKGFNDLATRHPELCMEWDYERNEGLFPQDILYSSAKKVWWKCQKCEHNWPTEIRLRANGSGCPKCVKRGRAKLAGQR